MGGFTDALVMGSTLSGVVIRALNPSALRLGGMDFGTGGGCFLLPGMAPGGSGGGFFPFGIEDGCNGGGVFPFGVVSCSN